MPETRFVELVRVSSEGQASRDTPEDQRRALDKLRLARPGFLVERIDGAVSGAKAAGDRVDIRRLGELARLRAFDEVRVRHLDRLTRHDDPRERFAIYGIIADADAIIVDTTGRELDPKSEMGELTYFFETLMASKERRRILERTQAGKERAARNGRLAEGRPPYARTFDKKTGKWGLDGEKARVYRELFKRYLEGQSLSQIAKVMEARGAPAPFRGPWTLERVRKLLIHPSAAGTYVRRGVMVQVPAIVDSSTQERVKKKLQTGRNWSGPKPTVNALVRKLAKCGACRKTLYVRGPTKRRYYTCPSCGTSHRVDRIDAAVKDVITDFLRNPELLDDLTADAPTDASAVQAARAIEEVEKELERLDREEEAVARMLRKGLVQQRVGDKQLEEVATLRRDAERRLEEARELQRNREVARDREQRLKDLQAKIDLRVQKDSFGAWRGLLVDLPFGMVIQPTGELTLEIRDDFDYSPVSGTRSA